jgi:large subunit ribosomal protein L30
MPTKKDKVGRIHIKWVKSASGAKIEHKRTIKALGFTKLQSEVTKDATPQILGMVKHVRHLVKVTEVAAS